MRTYPVALRLFRCIGALLISTLALSCTPPGTPGPDTDGDFIRSVSFGEADEDIGWGIAVDSSGNVYTTGYFKGTVDFDPGPGVSNLTSLGTAPAIFITKLNSSGGLVWAKSIGGAASCIGYGITVDSSGNVFTTGLFWGTVDFDPGVGTNDLVSAGWSDVFVLKLDTDGDFVWASSMGGTLYENGYDITLDSSGNVLLTGYFQGTADFDPDPTPVTGVFDLVASGAGLDIFISKLDSNGDFVWAKGIGGTSDDYGYGIATDTAGSVYTTGSFLTTVDFDPGAGTSDLTNTTGIDIFISKLDSNGDYVWAKGIGETFGGEGRAIAVDTLGNVYTTGYFAGTMDFDPGAGTSNLTSSGGSQDVFVSKLDTDGDFVWAGAMGGSLNDNGFGLSVDGSGNVYTTGFFQNSGDFDPGAGTYDLPHVANNDIFVSKLDSSGNFIWAKAMGGSDDGVGYGVYTDGSSNVYATGYFKATVDFDPDPGAGVYNLVSAAGSQDIFIVYIDGP